MRIALVSLSVVVEEMRQVSITRALVCLMR
jgi:hypothetical protein